MRLKKTIWRPLLLGIVLGTLAGIATVANLSLLVPGIDTENLIGFWMTLLLLSAALGGPLAGAMATTLLITLSTWFGPPELQPVNDDAAVVFWTNLFVVGTLMVLVGLAYRWIYERVKMPARLLPWIGVVITVHLLNAPANLTLQFYLLHEAGVLPAILGVYNVYVLQGIFDIIVTSLVFIALPSAYTRPLWYTLKPIPPRVEVTA